MTYDLPQLQTPALLGEGVLEAAAVMPALTEQERSLVRGFAGQIDASDPSQLSVYGAAEQSSMQTWLDVAIKSVADQDLHTGEQGVEKLLAQLRGFDRLCAARMFLFGRVSFSRLRKEYRELDPAVERTAGELLDQSIGLRRISKVLERMEQENQAHLVRLSTYLLCGQVRLAQLRAAQGMPALPATGAVNGETALSAQSPAAVPNAGPNVVLDAVSPADTANALELQRLERRVHDIALTRQVALQTRAQMVLLLEGNARMIEVMDRTLRQTLPLWKSQVLVSLGLAAQLDAQHEVERARREIERDMVMRNTFIARLLALLGVGHAGERQALHRSNEKLLGAVTDLQRALRMQQMQSERTQETLRSA